MDKKTPQPELLHITMRDRDRILFQGDATGLTSINEKGTFDVLPEHINFISIIKDSVIIHKPDGKDQEIKTTNGIMRVLRNDVKIYVGLVATTPAAPPNPATSPQTTASAK